MSSANIIHMGNGRNVHGCATARPGSRNAPQLASGDGTHRNHLLLLALLGQVLDAVDEELVGADVGPSGLDHPAAQLHQLGEKKTRGKETKMMTLNITTQIRRLFKECCVPHDVAARY